MGKKKDNVIDFAKNKKKQPSAKASSHSMQESIMNMAKRIEQLKTEQQKICEMAARTILKALVAKRVALLLSVPINNLPLESMRSFSTPLVSKIWARAVPPSFEL